MCYTIWAWKIKWVILLLVYGNKAFSFEPLFITKEMKWMGTIVCSGCNNTIDHYEDEKVTVLYGTCTDCNTCEHE